MVGQAHREHFVVLDGLRGVAALAVMVMHIGEILILPNFAPQAYLAVPFFFVLSGFVVTYAYEDGLMRRATAVGFMVVRIERLYPMLIVGLMMSTAFIVFRTVSKHASFHATDMLISLFAAITMIPRPGASVFAILPPQWSLALEFWGNLLHYVLRPLLTRGKLVILLPLLFAAMAWGSFHYGGLGTGWSLDNLPGGIATFAFSYSAGVLIFRLWREGRLPRVRMPLWAVVTLLIVTLAFPQPLRTLANAVRDLICTALLYPIILIAALQTYANTKLLGIASWFGRLSYPIYIIHFPIVTACCFALLRLKAPLWVAYAAVPLMVVLATATALILLIWVDEPLRSWAKDARISRLRAGPT